MSLHGDNTAEKWWEDIVGARRIATFSQESKIFSETHYYANPIMYEFGELHEMATWCWDTFGECGYRQDKMKTIWNYQHDPDYIFWFGEEKDLMLFILRWS